ncbi:MAG: hypothetical protein EOO05_08050 [Chitinophagaceae bacterium]|nr:MAG: hypothetical protein EOO05_08050 [Chitinophagaceae bacterium]
MIQQYSKDHGENRSRGLLRDLETTMLEVLRRLEHRKHNQPGLDEGRTTEFLLLKRLQAVRQRYLELFPVLKAGNKLDLALPTLPPIK